MLWDSRGFIFSFNVLMMMIITITDFSEQFRIFLGASVSLHLVARYVLKALTP